MAYNKYYLQKKQVSYDNGLTWEDVTPSETRQGAYIDSYDTLEECEAIPYSEQYLTFESLEDYNEFSFTNTIQYSLDDGNSWSTLQAYNSVQINSGETIMWKASGITPMDTMGIGTFSSLYNYKAYGNVMSLVYGDNFVGQTVINNYGLASLFENSNYLISVENLVLPATTLGNYCYCNMFSYCSNITTAPELYATTLTEGCYAGMFYGCGNLNSITCLATNISAQDCTSLWVNGVSSTGTFIKAASMNDWTSGSDGIPSGWTVIDNS